MSRQRNGIKQQRHAQAKSRRAQARRRHDRRGRRGRRARERSARPRGKPTPTSYTHPLWLAMADFLSPLGPPRSPADRRTLWTPLLLSLSAILLTWESAKSLTERLSAACATLEIMFPDVTIGDTYQGWIKALVRECDGPDGLHLKLAWHLRNQIRDVVARQHWMRDGWCAFVVDGTRIDCPRTRKNEKALGRAGRRGCGPQLYLTVMYHVGTGLPWCWKIGKSTASERHHLRSMLKMLPKGSLLIADCGLVGYDVLCEVRRRGMHYLIRAGGNVTLMKGLDCTRQTKQTAYLWPGQKRSKPPLPLRMIQVRRPPHKRPASHKKQCASRKSSKRGDSMWLITDLPQNVLSDAQAARFYALRWGVEVFFRALKQKLERRKMCCGNPAHARLELFWSMLALQLAGMMSVRKIIDAKHDPLNWSVTASLRLLRASARMHIADAGMHDTDAQLGRPARPRLDRQLSACRKDRYRRPRDKSARNWPHKKNESPPGAPRLRIATAAQVQRAKEAYARPRAA